MRDFMFLDDWKYAEREIEEKGTGKKYTLTQRQRLIEEDFYSIKRTVAVPHQDNEDYVNLYEVSYMIPSNGSCLLTRVVEEDVMKDVMEKHSIEILQGRMDFKTYFEGLA